MPLNCGLLATPSALYGYESHDEGGHLIPEYQTVPTITKATPTGTLVNTALIIIDPHKAEGRPPLMALPGQKPAWERSGHTIHL